MKLLILPFLFLLSCPCLANVFNSPETESSANTVSPLSYLNSYLSVETYNKIASTVSEIYEHTSFTPKICNSYFSKSDLSKVLALPFITTPGESFYFEVFGQLYDPQYNYLSRMDEQSLIYGFHYQSAVSERSLSNFAMGFGLSVLVSEGVEMKTLFSNKEIPGYGRNNLALGLEVSF